ncbi:DUF1826 domain-containing protein [uncultured Paraglaciecola sp.]|uniref:DUF1826 domain-containing protein n=1 Tax=uncultured Paraglaciecola sp. TaxID=1765024 RepID=UPI0030DD2F75|tara:strand:+ start:53076 stop:53744 length:669 start_codon:yes stop_codon:yes gene_type:complete
MNNVSVLTEITPEKVRISSESHSPAVLTDIYAQNINMCIWKRELSAEMLTDIEQYLQGEPILSITKIIKSDAINQQLSDILRDFSNLTALRDNIAELIDMFSCLFDLKQVGFRLNVLEHAMCPRFHVDKIPFRLITTFSGNGTQWLPHDRVNRDKLGFKSQGLCDEQSGLYLNADDIQIVAPGHVALLKGEFWEGNEEAGLVHRSPTASSDKKRLVMTLDFA